MKKVTAWFCVITFLLMLFATPVAVFVAIALYVPCVVLWLLYHGVRLTVPLLTRQEEEPRVIYVPQIVPQHSPPAPQPTPEEIRAKAKSQYERELVDASLAPDPDVQEAMKLAAYRRFVKASRESTLLA